MLRRTADYRNTERFEVFIEAICWILSTGYYPVDTIRAVDTLDSTESILELRFHLQFSNLINAIGARRCRGNYAVIDGGTFVDHCFR